MISVILTVTTQKPHSKGETNMEYLKTRLFERTAKAIQDMNDSARLMKCNTSTHESWRRQWINATERTAALMGVIKDAGLEAEFDKWANEG